MFYHKGVEQGARSGHYVADSRAVWLSLPVGAIDGEGVEGITDRKDPGSQGYALAVQLSRVSATVEVLVVRVNDLRCLREVAERPDNPVSDLRDGSP